MSARYHEGGRLESWPGTTSKLKTLIMVPTAAAMSVEWRKLLEQRKFLGLKQVKLITMQLRLPEKSRAITGLVV